MENLELFSRREILSVSDLVGRLKKLAEDRFSFIWVEGEISGLARPASGHVYFSLKDDKAMLRSVMFRQQASYLRFRLEEGQRILCQGRLSVYQPRGEIQLVVDTMEPRGAGALALAFEQVKKRLAAEGLFDQERKKPLPDLVVRVAVVTSPSGAAIRDFLRVLHARFSGIEVAIYPSLVQGADAPTQLIAAVEDLNAWGWPDVIVLTRGGGAPEDLWAFNDEGLARAIAASAIPVVSAVGHEIDFTISDMAADHRAPTPTAAAELLAAPMAERAKMVKNLAARLDSAGRRLTIRRRSHLLALTRALGDPSRRLIDKRLRVDDLLTRAGQALLRGTHVKNRRLWVLTRALHSARPDKRLAGLRNRFDNLNLRLLMAIKTGMERRKAEFSSQKVRLTALGPQAVLARGYAIVTDSDGKLLRQADPGLVNHKIDVRLARGGLKAEVLEVED